MKKVLIGLSLLALSATASADFFGSNNGEWKMGPYGPYYDESDWPEWTPMYWMQEFMDEWDNNDDNWGGMPYGGMPGMMPGYGMPYGGMPGYGMPGMTPGYGMPMAPMGGMPYGAAPMPAPVAPAPMPMPAPMMAPPAMPAPNAVPGPAVQ